MWTKLSKKKDKFCKNLDRIRRGQNCPRTKNVLSWTKSAGFRLKLPVFRRILSEIRSNLLREIIKKKKKIKNYRKISRRNYYCFSFSANSMSNGVLPLKNFNTISVSDVPLARQLRYLAVSITTSPQNLKLLKSKSSTLTS